MSSKLIACVPIGTHRIWRNDESRAIIVDDIIVKFSPTQYRLIIILLAGKPIPDSDLVRNALSCNIDASTRANLDKHMDKLRSKLHPCGLNVYRIAKYGYVLLDARD